MADDTGPVTDFFGTERATLLSDFASSPTGFILGLILTPLLNGVEGVVEKVLWAINYVFFGHSRSSTVGDLGLVDVPAVIATTLIDAGSAIGEPVLSVIGSGVQLLIDFFDWTGPAGLLGAAIVFAIVVVAYSTYLRTAIESALDFIPGGGAFIN
ncbi:MULTISPECIES: hypothetical protein [unclassified Haloarcula]|uniref:hypothetical protein n=1 Tax=unclassified Haloarcula TaxID=2624677 RepID=UPI001314125C|nr:MULTISPECIES: hypothetical protein [unclassified Haloarcula]